MGKKLFILLIILMSLSLVGIIAIQAYYISDAVDNEKARFKFNVEKALNYVSNTIEENEIEKYYEGVKEIVNKDGEIDTVAVSQFLIYQKNPSTKEAIIFRSDILEEDYKLSASLFDIGLDSIDFAKITGKSTLQVYNTPQTANKDIKSPLSSIIESGILDEAQRIRFEKGFKKLRKTYPIHKRVSAKQIRTLLSEKLKKDAIDIDFEFAIYSNGLATKVSSNNFEFNPESNYKVPIFYDVNIKTPYSLLVNFPDDRKFVLSGIMGMIFLSIVFTSIIILAYGSALFQLVRQRKISEIKTDFINNMTHEFKTPIATINLAIDAIKNPRIIEDKEKVLRYLRMIKEENKRMHAQVENVLRISKLEKNELNISKDRVNFHDLIEDALSHVELLVEDRQGSIQTSFNADQPAVLANETHFTNVIVNILDNAIKYSPETLKIEVFTENVGTNIILKIRDYGSGMSKAAAKRVFEKFYREHTGNIHNVKGQGLGLAYVKRIVEDHQGHVSVESEKDKGSTFIVKLPSIS